LDLIRRGREHGSGTNGGLPEERRCNFPIHRDTTAERILPALVTSELSPTPAAVRALVGLGPPAAMTLEGEDALLWAVAPEDDGSGWDALTPRRTPRQGRIRLHDEGILAACRAARSGHYNLMTAKFTTMPASRRKIRARRKPPIRIGSRRARAVRRRTPKLPLAGLAWSALRAGRRASA
jgi:hypothetical protein